MPSILVFFITYSLNNRKNYPSAIDIWNGNINTIYDKMKFINEKNIQKKSSKKEKIN